MKKATWPWEKRATGGTNSSYTDALIRTIVNQAGGTVANPSATGALEDGKRYDRPGVYGGRDRGP